MVPIIKREIINYLKRPLFWLGIAIVVFGVFQNVSQIGRASCRERVSASV